MSSKKYITNFRGDNYNLTPNGKMHNKMKKEPKTPQNYTDACEFEQFDNCIDNIKCEVFTPDEDDRRPRMSLSMNDITSLREDMQLNLHIESDTCEILQRYSRKAPHPTQELSRDKFVSMAEAIYHFQRDTPGRFHSTVHPPLLRVVGAAGGPGLTVPQSPALLCRTRARPVHVLSQKEKEDMEFEEIKKHKIKANPIPKSVIEGSKNLPAVPRRGNTVPEPFNLTEVRKKQPQPDEETYVFHARPAPRHVLEKAQMPKKPPIMVTVAVSPKFRKVRAHSHENLRNSPAPLTLARKKHTKVSGPGILFSAADTEVPHTGVPLAAHGQHPRRLEPFSFERRDEQLKKKKEQKIKQMIEEEKKLASQFKANPLPANIKKKIQQATSKHSISSTSSENKENGVRFEAKPAKVLYQKPFVPVLRSTNNTEPEPFPLATEKRACEREHFDRLIKEKEEEMEKQNQERERQMKELAERETARLRSQLVHRANPVPNFASLFLPEKSDIPLTVPETPKFIRRMKQH